MNKQREALEEIDQCFEAALVEGWIEALADGDIYRIRDIANRRLFYARGIAQQAAQQPAQAERERPVWQSLDSAPLDRPILLRDGDDIYKGQWDEGVRWVVFCGQPVVWEVDPKEWAEIPADQAQPVEAAFELLMRDITEQDPADPEHERTVSVNYDWLYERVQEAFASIQKPAQAEPDGWRFEKLPDDQYQVFLPDGGGCVVSERDDRIPAVVLARLASILSRQPRPPKAEPTSKVAEYQNALEKGLALICAAVGLENEHYDDDSKTDVENYLDCFKDAANWLEHAGVYWDRDAGCVVLSRPPKADSDGLIQFAKECLAVSRDGCDMDGGDIQELALKLGLIEPYTVTGPCGSDCVCAEVDDFPLTCYRDAELLRIDQRRPGND